MAQIGKKSQSFLREDNLIGISDALLDGFNLNKLFARDNNGKLIRSKDSIRDICFRNGIKYRMVFNAMNMRSFGKEDIKDAISDLTNFINELGVSGIVEFHAADKTQNSDHVHFWINTEDKYIYKEIASKMVWEGYSNQEDVYIQKYEENTKLKEEEYVSNTNIKVEQKLIEQVDNIEISATIKSIYKLLANGSKKPVKQEERIMVQDEKQIEFDNFIEETEKMYEDFLSRFDNKKNCSLSNDKAKEIFNNLNTQVESMKSQNRNRQKQ